MSLSEPFIRRPVMTTLVMATILFFGIISYENLPVSDLPNVDYPTIQVTVSNPGSNPETMACTCATPLEREFMTIEGLDTITSQSITGSTTIILQFVLNRSMDAAGEDVQAAINRAQPNLPQDLPYNPTYRKVNPAATPILYIAITSESMDLAELYDYGNTFIGQRLAMIEGVSQVITYGEPYAARIQINPAQLAGMDIGINEVASAVEKGNVDMPTGTIYGRKNEFTIDIDGQLMRAEGYNQLVLKAKDGSIVKVSDIGRALNSLENDKYYLNYMSRTANQPCVIIAIQRQPGENTVAVIQRIDKLLPTIQKQLPSSLIYHRVYDQSLNIFQSVEDVKHTLLIAFILVVIIIYLTLGKLLNTVIPVLALPLSIIGTFTVMYLLNFSIDILSLLALTLSIGFLVDDAIVVLENNVRHVQQGEAPLDAALAGSKEIAITILSMTLCLISVFIPMIFMGGVVGRLFREFALTIVIAIALSGIISLTLSPLLCRFFIPKHDPNKKKNFIERMVDKSNEKMLNTYKRGLTWTMKHRFTMLIIGLSCVVLSFFLYTQLPKGFLPNDDVSFLRGFTKARDGTSPFGMEDYQKKVGNIILDDPAVDYLVNASSVESDNEGLMFIRLKPYKERGRQDKVIERLMTSLYFVPGVNSFISELPTINLQIGSNVRALYQYCLTAISQENLNKYATTMETLVKGLPGLAQVSSDLEIQQPQLEMEIQRDRASDLGLTAQDIEGIFTVSYSNKKISTINTTINQFDVIIETLPEFYRNPSVVSDLYIKSLTTNQLIPLSEVVKFKENVGPLSVNHINGIPSATIAFNLDGIALSQALEEISKVAKENLPSSVNGSVQGTANVFQTSFADLPFLFIITFFIIYVILGILYESFIHPMTVMSALPPTAFGALVTLFIFREELNLYAIVGVIMLIGIVMKNGIMMVDFANAARENENKNAFDSIFEACLIRFRPILMTTVSALMGALPIALGIGGAAAATKRGLGLAVVGGLLISQTLTLFLTPVIYYYLEVAQEKISAISKKIFKKKVQEEENQGRG